MQNHTKTKISFSRWFFCIYSMRNERSVCNENSVWENDCMCWLCSCFCTLLCYREWWRGRERCASQPAIGGSSRYNVPAVAFNERLTGTEWGGAMLQKWMKIKLIFTTDLAFEGGVKGFQRDMGKHLINLFFFCFLCNLKHFSKRCSNAASPWKYSFIVSTAVSFLSNLIPPRLGKK